MLGGRGRHAASSNDVVLVSRSHHSLNSSSHLSFLLFLVGRIHGDSTIVAVSNMSRSNDRSANHVLPDCIHHGPGFCW